MPKQLQTPSNPKSAQNNLPSYMDVKSMQFEWFLITLADEVLQYENPGLLDYAMQSIPVQEMYDHAEKAFQLETAKAQSIGDERKIQWGYQDFVIRELLRCVSALDFDPSKHGLHSYH